MCRSIVITIRGGNLCGDWWQRPQFAWNLFSPSIRNSASLDWPALAFAGAEFAAGAGADLFCCCALAEPENSNAASEKITPGITNR